MSGKPKQVEWAAAAKAFALARREHRVAMDCQDTTAPTLEKRAWHKIEAAFKTFDALAAREWP